MFSFNEYKINMYHIYAKTMIYFFVKNILILIKMIILCHLIKKICIYTLLFLYNE